MFNCNNVPNIYNIFLPPHPALGFVVVVLCNSQEKSHNSPAKSSGFSDVC